MRIGLPREIKAGEARVALRPPEIATLTGAGHDVVVERGAGLASGVDDAQYEAAGALLTGVHAAAFDAELVVKVKELQPVEYPLVRPGTILLGFQQFAVEPAYLDVALSSGATFIACETIESDDVDAAHRLPILAAMSRVAGRMAVRLGAKGLTGSEDADLDGTDVIVIGAGAAGSAAALEAARRRARVGVFAASPRRFDALARAANGPMAMGVFDAARLRALLPTTRLLIGAVLVAGRTSPRLLDRAMIASMPPGSVFVDVGIDQRGIAETSRMTSLGDPFFTVDGVIHCGVPNLPALEPRAASEAYAAAVLPHVVALAERGGDALAPGSGLSRGVQVRRGSIVDARLALDTRRRPKPVAN